MAGKLHSRSASIVVEPFPQHVDAENVVVSFCRAPSPAILESTYHSKGYGRFSVFACDVVEKFRHAATDVRCPLQRLAAQRDRWPRVAPAAPVLPFVGGWIGYFTYEMGQWFEPKAAIPPALGHKVPPVCRLNLYDSFAVHDRIASQWYVAAVDWPKSVPTLRPPTRARLKRIHEVLRRAAEMGQAPDVVASGMGVQTSLDRTAYRDRFDHAMRYIEAGDIYQVNLTRRFSVRTASSPLDVYRRLRGCNPASMSALFPWNECAVMSCSPELFLDLAGSKVVTRPIKGTIARPSDDALLESARGTLRFSEKDQAELNMIVDLMRNDLGRVCDYGSVNVSNGGSIEDHPTVLHRVATVEGLLRAQCNWKDLLYATFPGGSITGAPKLRAMQIIRELEPEPRGVYCGSIGWIGLDDSMRLSIAIRTMVEQNGVVSFNAGGGIVADSDPDSEFEETSAKAAGMMRALGDTETLSPMTLSMEGFG